MTDIAKSTDRSSNVDIPSVGYKTSYESVMVTPSLTFYEDFVERKRFREIYKYNCCTKINHISLNLISLERAGI